MSCICELKRFSDCPTGFIRANEFSRASLSKMVDLGMANIYEGPKGSTYYPMVKLTTRGRLNLSKINTKMEEK